MRHLWSLLAGVVVAPLTWLFLATGQHRSQRVVADWDQTAQFDTVDLVGPVIYLAVAGMLLGLLGTLRWSPAGPLAAGLLFVLPTGLMFSNPFTTLEAFYRPADGAPRRLLGQDLEPWLPVANGTLLVLGALLLMAVFSAQRWRSWPAPAGAPAPVRPARPIPPASDAEVVSGISAVSALSKEETAAASKPGSTPESESRSDSESDTKHSYAMTDEEILAAAAAYEAESAPTRAARPASSAPAPPAPASSAPASAAPASAAPAPPDPELPTQKARPGPFTGTGRSSPDPDTDRTS